MKDFKVFKLVLKSLIDNTRVVLAIVVESDGSSPGKPGFKMAVAQNGVVCGTIGGGITEYNIIEDIKRFYNNEKSLKSLNIQVLTDNKDSTEDGQICGGTQKVILYECKKGDVQNIEKILKLNKSCAFGMLSLTPAGIEFTVNKRDLNEFSFSYESEHKWKYRETVGTENSVYIIGGGHVGLALSRILSTLDFYIVVIDDRPDIDTLKKNSFADEIICKSYLEVDKLIPEGDSVYIVIMTAGHKADRLVLEKLINKSVKYLGMMGSRGTVDEIFSSLQKKGISKEFFRKVRAPIGIQIKSHTPEEIAVSICAELIKIKNYTQSIG